MGVYDDFALLYAKGRYPEYSLQISNIFLPLIRQFGCTPQTLLDLACGEGTFAVKMAKQGIQVTGVDRSQQMLNFAETKSHHEKVQITWRKLDIREIDYSSAFDVITCWFDSLNYLLELDHLCQTFQLVRKALRKDGLFIFDMNTIFWLATLAKRYACSVERDIDDIFQVHRHFYDDERNIATFKITGFIKEEGWWLRRVDETHHERGYTLDEIRTCIKKAGLTELACYGNLTDQTPWAPESRRLFFISQR
ncbi:MAG: class I SAM-dependent methyltransferase [Candidatus Thorarchaeota archaeon]